MAANFGKKATAIANKLIALAKPHFEVFMKYAKVELAPPTPLDLPEFSQAIGRIFQRNGNLRNLTVREAWLNTLITMEVCSWFYIGEVIGKRHIVGYNV